MARPKGSKNRKNTALSIDEQIQQAEARVEAAKQRVEAAKAELKDAEADLKSLNVLRDEEQLKALMTAIAASGKSVDDVIALVNGNGAAGEAEDNEPVQE